MSYDKICGIGLFLTIIFLSSLAFSQEKYEALIDQIIEDISPALPDDYDFSELTERLTYYYRNPLNINKINREQLQELAFLSQLQINAFLIHRQENGNLLNLVELQSISTFDTLTIRRLLPFVTLGSPNSLAGLSASSLYRKGSNDLMFRYGQYLQKQKGYKNSDEGGSVYAGTAGRLLVRYRYQYGNNVSASLTLEKDPGEKLFSQGRSLGFDFGSANVFVRNVGPIKKIVAGDYSLQFGQGLAMWSGLSFGKSSMITNLAKPESGLQPYRSSNEILFLRGTAFTVRYKNVEITPFVSFRKIDGSVDTTITPQITSMSQSGLHRTSTELENKNAVAQNIIGANVLYAKPNFKAGLTAYHTKLNYPVQSGQRLYDLFDFSGSNLLNLAVNYGFTLKNSYFFGEAAHSGGDKIAFINGIMSSLTPVVSTVLLHRHYPKEYHSFFNQAVAETSNPVNENGFYAGLTIRPSKWELAVYSDYFRFPWLKFGVDGPSTGYEMLAQITYRPTKSTQWEFRYKAEQKQDNDVIGNPINFLEDTRKEGYRIGFSSKINQSFTLRNRLELATYRREASEKEYGWLVYQDIRYDPVGLPYSGNLRIALFNTSGFNTRIYAYENDVLFSYSIPAYQNSGIRFYLNGRYSISRKMDVWLRYSISQYKDLDVIGSGNDQINGTRRSDIKIQFRYQY